MTQGLSKDPRGIEVPTNRHYCHQRCPGRAGNPGTSAGLDQTVPVIGWKNSALKVWIWGQMCGHSLPQHQHGRARPGLSLGGSSYLWIRRRHCLRGALKVTHRRQSPAFCPAQRTLALICARFTFCLKHVLQRGSRLLSLVREDAPGQLSPRTTTTEPVPLSPCSSTREATAVRSPRTAARE